MRNEFVAFTLVSLLLTFVVGRFLWEPFYFFYILLVPLLLLGLFDMFISKNNIRRNFPIIGRGRQLMEELRPKIYQYFIESDTNGTPINRMNRQVVYQRARQQLDTNPFGTKLNVYVEGYEWMHHSIGSLDPHKLTPHPKTRVGGRDCQQPYELSILNVSAMSFGSLSKNAVLALNGGARIGGFAHNTGEGGISPYHLEPGGDLIYQFGTGYFGCRDADGRFSEVKFRERSSLPQVKMIELKLSQGAKPGHGGILPGRKVTEEIAEIRGIEPGKDVISPPFHTAFSTPIELMHFIGRLRELSDGKPVGFKLCIGSRREFIAVCKAMVETGFLPDFITVDGGEGGTGAAPLEFSNSVGMPYREGLAFAYNCLQGFGLKEEIKILTSGKVITGFDIFRAIALGADACCSARAMMLALGCIQALECNRNTCPTGVTTQDPELVAGLRVRTKTDHVARYHKETVESFVELMAAAGVEQPDLINRSMVFRRLNMQESQPYSNIYPYLPRGCLLDRDSYPEYLLDEIELASPDSFGPVAG